MTVENDTFITNHAKIAGAIFCDYGGSIKVNSSNFIKNSAEICSAIDAVANATIINSNFINNTANFVTSIVLGDVTLKDNSYLNNAYGLFVLKDNKIYDENMKRLELITFKAPDVKVEYNSNKNFKVTLTHKFTNKPIHDAYLLVKDAKTGKLLFEEATDSKGIANFAVDLKVGTHKVKVYLDNNIYYGWESTLSFCHEYSPDPVSSTITVTKIQTKVKAPKITAKYKKSINFKITVKSGKNPVKKVQIKVKIGKKTYKLKTDKKGVAKFNTKKLKVGKYSVVISSGDGNYNINAKSKITIKK